MARTLGGRTCRTQRHFAARPEAPRCYLPPLSIGSSRAADQLKSGELSGVPVAGSQFSSQTAQAASGGLELRSFQLPPPREGPLQKMTSGIIPASWGRVLGSGQPRDIAKTVAFLASDASAFLSGAIIPVDGAGTA
jgi:hypothetical protein